MIIIFGGKLHNLLFLLTSVFTTGVGDMCYLPALLCANAVKSIHPTMIELLTNVKLIGSPNRRKRIVNLHIIS